MLATANWLRIVVAGQSVPPIAGTKWEDFASPIELRRPDPSDWFEYGNQFKEDLTLETVELMCEMAANKPSLLSQLLGPEE